MVYAGINQVIGDFLVGFRRDPEAFTEDTDLRRDLFSALYRHFSDLNLKFRMSREDLALSYYPERETLVLNPVRTAYPEGYSFDIAVLDTGGQGSPEGEQTGAETRYARYWRQKVAVGLQIHLCGEDQDPEKYYRKLQSDLQKFRKYREEANPDFSGLSLLLVRGEVRAEGNVSEVEDEGIPADGVHVRIVAENGTFAWFEG